MVISASSWVGAIISVSVKEITDGGFVGESMTLNSGILSTGNGNYLLPAYSFTNAPTSGMFYDEGTSTLSFSAAATKSLWVEFCWFMDSGRIVLYGVKFRPHIV